MSTYTPRPGSKTEAALDYLRAHGGRATAVDIADTIDTERKNLHALFAPAIAAGLIAPCALPAGPGYALVGAAPEGAPVAVASAGADTAAAAKPAKAPAKPAKATKPAKPPKSAKPAKAAKVPKPAKPAAPPTAPDSTAPSFRCGYFSDGTLRLEGCQPDMCAVGGGYGGVNLSPGAAAVLSDFIRSQK